MIEMIKKAAAEFLGLTIKEVGEARDALHAEVATELGRVAARTQITHPEGSSTTLNKAADTAQQEFAKVRKKLEAGLPEMMKLLLAYEVAQQRRDEAAAARDRHWDAEITRRSSGVHPKVDDFFRRLFAHGVTPHNLAQHRDEDVAIIADLHRWKAEDPTYGNPDNPWREVYDIYATRVIAVPGGGRTVKRSVIGTPVATKRYAADKWYLFNAIAAKIRSVATAQVPAIAAAAPAPALGPIPAAPQSAPVPEPAAVSPRSANLDTGEDEAIDVGMDHTADEMLQPGVEAGASVAAGAPSPEIEPAAGPGIEEAATIESPAVNVGTAAAVVDSSAREEEPQLDRESLAREMAEAVYATFPTMMGIYWPKSGVERGDYDPAKLIPALEAWIASGAGWSGPERFLAAARDGRAREFIEEQRRLGIDRLATRLLEGDKPALRDAKWAGCDVDLLKIGASRY